MPLASLAFLNSFPLFKLVDNFLVLVQQNELTLIHASTIKPTSKPNWRRKKKNSNAISIEINRNRSILPVGENNTRFKLIDDFWAETIKIA